MTGSDPAHELSDVAESEEGFYTEAKSSLGAAEQGKDEKGWSALVNGVAEGQYLLLKVVSASTSSSQDIKACNSKLKDIHSYRFSRSGSQLGHRCGAVAGGRGWYRMG